MCCDAYGADVAVELRVCMCVCLCVVEGVFFGSGTGISYVFSSVVSIASLLF